MQTSSAELIAWIMFMGVVAGVSIVVSVMASLIIPLPAGEGGSREAAEG